MINWLQHLRQMDSKNVGPKAANLGELISIGIPVPNGFVFHSPSPWGYYDLMVYYNNLGAGNVAVRSSAVAEDMKGASFAGHYDTYLNVEGEDRLLEAVRNCFASIDNEIAIAYRAVHGIKNKQMAVLIQKMILAEYSGVMFTKNPVTNNDKQVMIESVRGLGDKLVAGHVNPENYIIKKETAVIVKSPDEGMLHREHLYILLDYGTQIEEHYGETQDIEWCIKDGKVWIMQTRPITT